MSLCFIETVSTEGEETITTLFVMNNALGQSCIVMYPSITFTLTEELPSLLSGQTGPLARLPGLD